MIYFTSDFHFNHEKMVVQRKFENIKEMNISLLELLRDTLKSGDEVYHIGDFLWSSKAHNPYDFLKVNDIPGAWTFIIGNHDNFSEQSRYKQIFGKMFEDQYITMCHYPMVSWNRSHYGAWQLYGHHHWNSNEHPDFDKGLKMNVSLEANNFKLVSYNEVAYHMTKRIAITGRGDE